MPEPRITALALSIVFTVSVLWRVLLQQQKENHRLIEATHIFLGMAATAGACIVAATSQRAAALTTAAVLCMLAMWASVEPRPRLAQKAQRYSEMLLAFGTAVMVVMPDNPDNRRWELWGVVLKSSTSLYRTLLLALILCAVICVVRLLWLRQQAKLAERPRRKPNRMWQLVSTWRRADK